MRPDTCAQRMLNALFHDVVLIGNEVSPNVWRVELSINGKLLERLLRSQACACAKHIHSHHDT